MDSPLSPSSLSPSSLSPSSLSQRLAPLVLPEAGGGEVRLGSLWERNPAAVVFLRHYGCIFCREHAARLREREFKEAGVALAAIGLGDANYARLFREETGIVFPLLIDENRIAYKATALRSANPLHLLWRENAASRTRARASGHRQHRLGRNPFQLGGSFVFAPGNRDLFAHISATFGDNATPEALLGAIRNAR